MPGRMLVVAGPINGRRPRKVLLSGELMTPMMKMKMIPPMNEGLITPINT